MPGIKIYPATITEYEILFPSERARKQYAKSDYNTLIKEFTVKCTEGREYYLHNPNPNIRVWSPNLTIVKRYFLERVIDRFAIAELNNKNAFKLFEPENDYILLYLQLCNNFNPMRDCWGYIQTVSKDDRTQPIYKFGAPHEYR